MKTLYLAILTGLALQTSGLAQNLLITNYQNTDVQKISGSVYYTTFSADVVNKGGAISSLTATLSSSASYITVLPGQNVLMFGAVPANSQVTSKNTFTIIYDRSSYFDVTDLHWAFSTGNGANPIANAGPNQTVNPGTTVFLTGAASTNPSGNGTLSYSWAFSSKPAASHAVIYNPTSVTPTFVADAGGSYVVQLTVSNGSASNSATVTISTTNTPPVANAGPNQTAGVGTTVTLDGSASTASSGNPLTYSWFLASRPTGSVAALTGMTTVNPTFVIDKLGSYVAQLIVNDGLSNSAISTVTISTFNTPPVANAGPNQVVFLKNVVQLDGSGSTDVDGNSLTFAWSFLSRPAGSAAALSSATAVKPTFTADVAGTFVVQLVVNDGTVNSPASTVMITTNSLLPPVANAGPNQTVVHNSTVVLNGSGTDPQGLALTYQWSLLSKPAGSNATLSNPAAAGPTFVADKPGNYIAQLIVSNGTLNSPAVTVTITTTNTPPVANAGSNQSGQVGTLITLNGNGSSDADNDPLTFTWGITSRPSGSVAALMGATSATPSFTPDQAGMYVVQLIVNDGYANSAPVTVTITAQSGIILPVVSNVSPNQTTSFPVTLSMPSPSGTYVFLTSSDPNIITVSPGTLVFPQGSTTSTVAAKVTGVNYGSASILATAYGLPSASQTVQVAGTVNFYPSSLNMAPNSIQGLNMNLSSPAPDGGLTVNLTSSNTKAATVPSSVTFNAGDTAANFVVRSQGVGTATIHASAPPFIADATLPVNVVVPPAVLLPSFDTVGQTVLGDVLSAELPVTLSVPAPAGGVTVSLSSSDNTVLVIQPSSVFIPAGALAPVQQPRIIGYIIAYATVTASAPGYTTASLEIQVWDEARLALPSNLTVAVGQTATMQVNLPGAAPAGGVTVMLTSSNPAVASISQTVFIPAGANTAPVEPQLKGLAVGQSSISASAAGYTSAAQTIYVVGP